MSRFLAIVIVLALAAGGGYWWWTTTPPYAVGQAALAIKKHDLGAFHNWVDVHGVSSSAIDDTLAEPMKAIGASNILARVIGLSILGIFRPAAVDALDRQIDTWVAHGGSKKTSSLQEIRHGSGMGRRGNETASESNALKAEITLVADDHPSEEDDDTDGSPEPQPKGLLGALTTIVNPPSLKQVLRDEGFTAKTFRGIGQNDTQGNIAHVGLKFFSPKHNREVNVLLELNNTSGHWQIDRIANLQEILSTLAEAPPAPQQPNQPGQNSI